MPELAERTLSPKDIGVELQSSPFATILSRKKEALLLNLAFDNEFNAAVTVLKPLKPVVITETEKEYAGRETTKEISFDEQLNQTFAYLSRTRRLETGTEKTQYLQEIVNGMLEKDDRSEVRDLQTRLVVMNKGEDATAFVTADGTIFV